MMFYIITIISAIVLVSVFVAVYFLVIKKKSGDKVCEPKCLPDQKCIDGQCVCPYNGQVVMFGQCVCPYGQGLDPVNNKCVYCSSIDKCTPVNNFDKCGEKCNCTNDDNGKPYDLTKIGILSEENGHRYCGPCSLANYVAPGDGGACIPPKPL